ncbi:hypothetical protein Tco_0751499 [Tanacetum coccineum]|uniref:Uncharacterized protein n=1 Tax=Tanacetum coccineum TaxID=301880 RepID=A0ABQ4Z483_9ASTR
MIVIQHTFSTSNTDKVNIRGLSIQTVITRSYRRFIIRKLKIPTVVFYFLLLPLTIVRHDSIFQLIALKLWSANTSSGNYSCRERHALGKICAVTGFEKSWDTFCMVTGFDFEKSFFARESEKIAGLPKIDCL